MAMEWHAWDQERQDGVPKDFQPGLLVAVWGQIQGWAVQRLCLVDQRLCLVHQRLCMADQKQHWDQNWRWTELVWKNRLESNTA